MHEMRQNFKIWRSKCVVTFSIICNLAESHFLSDPQQARCSEDLLRNKIKALEAQLQLCLQVKKKKSSPAAGDTEEQWAIDSYRYLDAFSDDTTWLRYS